MFSKGLTEGMTRSKAAVNAEVDRFLEDELSLRLKKKLRRKAELARASLSCLEVPRPFRDYPPPDIVYYGALRKANIAKHVAEDHEKRKARTMPGSERARFERIQQMKAMKESMLAEDGDAETREARELSYASGELFKALDTDGSGELSREEMANGAPLLGLGVHEALVLFDKLDVDKSGMVDFTEFQQALTEMEKQSMRNIVDAIMEGDEDRLERGLLRFTAEGSEVVPKRLRATVTVARDGAGQLGSLALMNFPNQNGKLGRRLGGQAALDRRVPICSHIITDELSLEGLGKPGYGTHGGLFAVDGDSLLHVLFRNAHVPNRLGLAAVLLKAGANPNVVNAHGQRPFDVDLEGHRLSWRRDNEDRAVAEQRRKKAETGVGDFASLTASFAAGGL